MTWVQKSKSISLIGFDIRFLFLLKTAISVYTLFILYAPCQFKIFSPSFRCCQLNYSSIVACRCTKTNQEGSLFCGTFTCRMKRFHRGFGTNYSSYHSCILFRKSWICLRFSLPLKLNQNSWADRGKRNNITEHKLMYVSYTPKPIKLKTNNNYYTTI